MKIPLPNLQSTLQDKGNANRAVKILIRENVSPEFMGIFDAHVDMSGQIKSITKEVSLSYYDG
ncbi:hypothetical protein GcC1_115024 [Golovinomyces cichoracearum]|uniref:Uncharacterized protein n=1 Tax=Golovinomyces cichoracearum TaxID=62708 RepID=A0A420I810_9PEZI|nr:hypothetical protein GcC1_115024 [Golovinomyces cichoracearum]